MTIEFSTHPEYDVIAPELQKYKDLYEGKHAVLINPQYLWPHEIEGSRQEKGADPVTGATLTVGEYLRMIRARRSRYVNIYKSVVTAWISILFHKPIKYDDDVKNLLGEEGLADIDGEGTSFEDFIKGPIAEAYFLYGSPIVLVDAPSGMFKNKQEQANAGFRPYMELLDRLAVKDWQFFTDGKNRGKYEWLRHEYCSVAPRTSSRSKAETEIYCKEYTVASGSYAQDIYKLEDGKWKAVDSVPIGGDELPISTIRANEPWVDDLSEIALVFFNVTSAWYNQLNTQAFQRGILAGDLGEKEKIAISEYTFATVPTGTTVDVIEPASTDAHTSAMNITMDQFYRVGFNRSRGMAADSKEAPSDQTLREMSSELIALLITAMSQIEGLVNESLTHYARFNGIEDFQGKVTLSRDIASDDVMKQAEIFAIYRDEIRKVLTWRKAELKKVSLQMGYSDDEAREIEREIDALKLEEPLDPLDVTNDGKEKANQASSNESDKPVGSEGSGTAPAA